MLDNKIDLRPRFSLISYTVAPPGSIFSGSAPVSCITRIITKKKKKKKKRQVNAKTQQVYCGQLWIKLMRLSLQMRYDNFANFQKNVFLITSCTQGYFIYNTHKQVSILCFSGGWRSHALHLILKKSNILHYRPLH